MVEENPILKISGLGWKILVYPNRLVKKTIGAEKVILLDQIAGIDVGWGNLNIETTGGAKYKMSIGTRKAKEVRDAILKIKEK